MSLGYAEKLIMGFGARRALVTGLALAAAGIAWLARSPVDGNYVTDLLPVMLLLGTGAGTAMPALMTLSMSGATREDSGLASGLVNTTVQVGGAIGLAVLATVASEHTAGLVADGESLAEATVAGYRVAYVIGTALMVAAIGVALTVIKRDELPAAGAEEAEGGERAPGEPAYHEAA
jgi:MFS family permease